MKDYNKELVGEINGYEIWYVKTCDGAKYLGSNAYMNYNTKWCISTKNGEYYWNNNYKNDTFYFLIRKVMQMPHFNQFDKLAFQYHADGSIIIWDMNNKKNTFKDEIVIQYMKDNFKWIDKLTDSERYFRTPNLRIDKNEDGTIDIHGSIYIDSLDLDEVPWKGKFIINALYGDLNANYNNLTSFKDFPKIIHGDCNVCGNQLNTDFGDLELVKGNLDISENNISEINHIKVHGMVIK